MHGIERLLFGLAGAAALVLVVLLVVGAPLWLAIAAATASGCLVTAVLFRHLRRGR